MEFVSPCALSPNADGKRKIFRAKNQSYSQQIEVRSVSPVRNIKSLPANGVRTCSKKESDTDLVSIGKKIKMRNGAVNLYNIETINSYTGKSVYQQFFHGVKIPVSCPVKMEPENLLTDDDLIEFTVNSIKSWVSTFVKQVI